MDCLMCKSKRIVKVFSDYPGYIEGSNYEIFKCKRCSIHFIDTNNLDKKVYEIIYSREDIPGYDRYFKYFKKIKSEKDPLKFLVGEEPPYYVVYSVLKKTKKKLKILEVGCGYGYLTYCLNKRGHNAIGIDVSKNAIKQANANLGKNYYHSSLEDFKREKDFDLIVATEVIEHVADPYEFIADCASLLKKGGRIIFSTPNKTYFPKDFVWASEFPPVHTVWLNERSFRFAAKQQNLKCEFVDFSKHITRKENKLVLYFLTRRKNILTPMLDSKGKPFQNEIKPTKSIFKRIIKTFIWWYPVAYVSNLFTNFISSENFTLGIILTKK